MDTSKRIFLSLFVFIRVYSWIILPEERRMTQRRTFLRGWVVAGLTLVAALGLFLVGVLLVGRLTREQIRDSGRYTTPFTEVACPAPPTGSRAEFLAEVQYLADLPDRLNVLDDDLARRLAAAFAAHPWVRQVQRVEIVPPHEVRVRLTYRLAVLAVARNGAVRAVDGQGTLLPAKAPTEGLPVLRGRIGAPAGAAGTTWGDPTVLAAAQTAGMLQPLERDFRLTAVEAQADGLRLRTADGSWIVWGRGPGEEAVDEAPAARKCERLREHCARHGGLDRPGGPGEYDVRPANQLVRRPLPKR
jgi:hypothetical protein